MSSTLSWVQKKEIKEEKQKQQTKFNVKQMRIVYSITVLSLILAIVCIVLAFYTPSQVPSYATPSSGNLSTSGIDNVLTNYQTNNTIMTTPGLLFSPNRQNMFLFSDNLYLIRLPSGIPTPIVWSASPTNFSLNPSSLPILSLTAQGILQVEILDPITHTYQILWSSKNNKLEPTANYYLQVTNSPQLQILSSLTSEIIWSVP